MSGSDKPAHEHDPITVWGFVLCSRCRAHQTGGRFAAACPIPPPGGFGESARHDPGAGGSLMDRALHRQAGQSGFDRIDADHRPKR